MKRSSSIGFLRWVNRFAKLLTDLKINVVRFHMKSLAKDHLLINRESFFFLVKNLAKRLVSSNHYFKEK